jgi:UDP-N-acetylglucosamine 2-epimerase
MTCHRRENIESEYSIQRILELANQTKEKVVFAAGYRTQQKIKDFRIAIPTNVKMIDPIGYAELLELAVDSVAILTDSGTLVEEAAVLGVPTIQMRTSTERPQVYDTGGSVKFDPHQNYTDFELKALVEAVKNRRGSMDPHTLGDGMASQRISDDLISRLASGDWRGHHPDSQRRPISRNFGFGSGDRGKP